jgi:membrane protease subunit HflC
MDAERKRVANELRSQGSAEAEKIRADADKQREVIVAEAYRDAQKMKGEGDAKAASTYAEAFEKNPSSTPSIAALKPIAAASRARTT